MISFRKACADDVAAIVSLLADDMLGQQREDASTPTNPSYLKAFTAIDQDPNQLLVVAELDGMIAGCLQLTFVPGLSRLGAWRGQIESVRVSSSHRGIGLGQALLEWAIERCRARGCRLVQLTTDKNRPDARRFYENLGFAASHDGMKLTIPD